jgi:hypothetical protein
LAQPEPEEEARGGRRRRRRRRRRKGEIAAAAAARSCAFHLSSPGRTGVAAAAGLGRGQHAGSQLAPPPDSGPNTRGEREGGGGGG